MTHIKLHDASFTRTWKLNLSRSHVSRLDNGHLVSIGLVLGDDVTEQTLARWIKTGIALEVANDNGGAW